MPYTNFIGGPFGISVCREMQFYSLHVYISAVYM